MSRPRRVLHVLKFYRPDFTGEGVFLERSSAVMQELAPGVEHELLVTRTAAPARAPEDACSTLGRVAYLSRQPQGAFLHHLALLGWFLRHVWRYDVVHVRTHADWYFLSYLLVRLAGRRLVLSATLDDSVPGLVRRYRPGLRPLALRGFRALFDAFVGISPRLHEETLGVVGDPARCRLLPCGITIPPGAAARRGAVRAQIGAAPGDAVMLFVGGLCARKDPLALVEALPAIRAAAPGTRLVLVGPELEPDYVAALRARVAALGLEGAVHFAGKQDDPHPFFAAADLLAFASRLEGFGTVVPEAMAHGLPVVARRLPGVNEDFVVEGETGFPFDDEAGLVAACVRLARDGALRARLGAAGQALARARFGMGRIAAGYLQVYGFDVPEPPAEQPPTGLGTGASVLDRRFHSPAAPPPGEQPLLLTMVDAEESFDWGRPFDRANTEVRSMRAQVLAHRVFERHGVRPLYLADFPVAAQDAGRAPLRELIAAGVAELGAQLHPWVTPPYEEEVNEAHSFVGSLEPRLELEKAHRLTETLEEAFGTRPRIFRAGRFGVGPRTADILRRLGYLADTSVVPCWPAGNCPDPAGFWRLSARPFWLDAERSLLEIPVSAALVGRLAGVVSPQLASRLFRPLPTALSLPSAVARAGLLERIRLSPEGMTVAEAKRLTRAMRAGGHRVFVLTYHSPSLEAGNTPYVRTAEDLRRFLAWLDEYYAFFREEIGGRPASWREVRGGEALAPAAPVAEAAA
ncbi:glycosyltransferase [Roseococcus sp. DSY-14]|uniref:glycosyltransferase n=1 Tax=Roseococcus sp. DSY-14 TaxID=3369650 RepID=UPI00387B7949